MKKKREFSLCCNGVWDTEEEASTFLNSIKKKYPHLIRDTEIIHVREVLKPKSKKRM